MVLCLKARESRSPPGQPKTETKSLLHMNSKTAAQGPKPPGGCCALERAVMRGRCAPVDQALSATGLPALAEEGRLAAGGGRKTIRDVEASQGSCSSALKPLDPYSR